MGDECPVCYQPCEKVLLLPCHHGYCRRCIVRWIESNDACPMCRTTVVDVGLSASYDVCIPPCPSDDTLLGITVSRDTQKHIYVVEVTQGGIAYECGIREKDRIVRINDIPLRGKQPRSATNIMEQAKHHQLPMRIRIDRSHRVNKRPSVYHFFT